MSNIQKERGQSKYYANKGVKRNKKPLRNIVYRVTVKDTKTLSSEADLTEYTQYIFKDEGILILEWNYEGDGMNYWYGLITPDKLKELIGNNQWGKFCQGKRVFINQRRVDGKNI